MVAAIMLEFTLRINAKCIVEILLKDGKRTQMNFAKIKNEKVLIYNCKNFRYHVPRSWLKPSGNLLVVFEESGGDPTWMTLVGRTA